MLQKNSIIKLTKAELLGNYEKFKNLNNYYHWKLKNASNSVIEYSYFINWKNEKLLNELFHNPNFILEFNKTYEYKLLSIKGVYANHSTIPYLNKFVHNRIDNQIHFYLYSINPKTVSDNYSILMTSPGNIVYDLDLCRRSTDRLSNILLKVKNVDTDTLLQTNNISESYAFPYNYGLVNKGWVNYDTTTSELGIETILPIFFR